MVRRDPMVNAAPEEMQEHRDRQEPRARKDVNNRKVRLAQMAVKGRKDLREATVIKEQLAPRDPQDQTVVQETTVARVT